MGGIVAGIVTVVAGVAYAIFANLNAIKNAFGDGDSADPWSPTASYSAGDVVFYAGKLYESAADHTGDWQFNASNWMQLPAFQGAISESFFRTSRGQQAVAHAIERMRARLRYASRAVRIRFETPLEDVLDLQIDDRVSISHPAMPGRMMVGKIIGYAFSASNDGRRYAEIEIGCCVGRGGDHAPTLPDLSALRPPVLGPTSYPSTGKITPTAADQLAQLRQAPDAYDVSIRVEIDAPAVPVAPRLAFAGSFDCGSISLETGVDLE